MIYESRFTLKGRSRVTGIGEIANDLAKNGEWVNAVNERGETPLHIAARHKKYDLFETMLPHFDNVEACDNERNTVMHALLDGCVSNPSKYDDDCSKMIRTLIVKGGQVNKRNRNGWTPVHLAARNCQIEVLSVLERDKADFSLRTKDGETVLHLACQNMANLVGTAKEMDIINNLIEHGCDVNAENVKGYSVLHYAVDYCSVGVVEKLIGCGADLNCETNSLQLTPLHLATRNKNLVVMETLIKAGANVNSAAHGGLTPLSLAVIMGSLDIVKYLLKNATDLDYRYGWTPLHLAIYLRRKRVFKLFIQNQTTNVNVPGVDLLTPLHVAAMLGSFKHAKILIDRGANVNSRDANEYTPLHAALKSYHYPDVRHLMQNSYLKYSIDSSLSKHFELFFNTNRFFIMRNFVVNLGGKKKISRILIESGAEINAVTKNNENPLYFAAENGDVDLVRILLKQGAKVDCQEKREGCTPLHAATRKNRVDVVRELISANANLEITANDGKNPLHLAAFYDRAAVVKELLEGKIDVNVTTKYGRTALHLATMSDYTNVARELLSNNADVNIRDKDGKSPLDLAMDKEKSKVLKLLINRESGISVEDKRLKNSLLHIAARENDTFTIKHLVAFGAKVNVVNAGGFTPLHCAVRSGNVDAARALIGFDANVNCKSKKCESTPLHLALKNPSQRQSLVEMLIKANANVKLPDVEGVTPLHLAILHNANEYLTSERSTIVESLIVRGGDVDCVDRVFQFTPLHVAVHNRDWNIFEIVISRANVNVSDKNGLTPLHLASMLGSVEFAKALLREGAYINRRDTNNYTPLHFAIRGNRVTTDDWVRLYSDRDSWMSKSSAKPHKCVGQNYGDLIELLIESGADLKTLPCKGTSMFYFAAEANAVAVIKNMMETGITVNFEESHSGLTALQRAVLSDHKETVELLVSSGADVNVVTESGRNLLHLAAQSGGTRVLEYLLPQSTQNKMCPFLHRIDGLAGCHKEFNVNARDRSGMTPLHLAAFYSNQKQAAETLLFHGALADAQDDNGCLPIHYAIGKNNHLQLESLLAFGVDINDSKVYNKLDLNKMEPEVKQCLFEHIMKLKALDFPVASFYESIVQERGYLEDGFYKKCLKEIDEMKVYFIGEKVNLYDLLHVNRRGRRTYRNNLELQGIEKKFPIYYSFILDFYHETIVKKSMIKKAELALIQLTEFDFPIVCTDKIFHYLRIISLAMLIKAANVNDVISKINYDYEEWI